MSEQDIETIHVYDIRETSNVNIDREAVLKFMDQKIKLGQQIKDGIDAIGKQIGIDLPTQFNTIIDNIFDDVRGPTEPVIQEMEKILVIMKQLTDSLDAVDAQLKSFYPKEGQDNEV